MSDRFQIIYYIVNFYSMANECIRPTKINCCLLRHRRFCVFTAALIVFTLRKKNCVCFRSFPELFWVRSVSLLIVIIVSKAFMSKACMVVSGISCHCIWTNTDYYNKKKVPLCLIKMFGNWPGKLIIFFPWPNSATFYCSAYTKPGKWVVM